MASKPRFARKPLELLNQARFADASFAAHMHHMASRSLPTCLQGRDELANLNLAIDERVVIRQRTKSGQPPRAYRLIETLDANGAYRLDLQPAGERINDHLRDENLARLRGISQTRGEIHAVSSHRIFSVA